MSAWPSTDPEVRARQRAACEAALGPEVTAGLFDVAEPSADEPRTLHTAAHSRADVDAPERFYMRTGDDFTLRKATVTPLSDAEFALIADIVKPAAQARVTGRAFIDQLLRLVVTGARWGDLPDATAIRLRLGKTNPALFDALRERAAAMSEDRQGEIEALCTFCQRWLARIKRSGPGTVAAKLRG